MNRNPIPPKQVSVILLRGRRLVRLSLLLWLGAAMLSRARSEAQSEVAGTAIRATQVLGFEAERHNGTGELKILDDVVQFQRNRRAAAQIRISSIQNIFIGCEDKQVGGTPMMLAKTAAPFGGGRVVSLFSHEKYDLLTIEYLDNSGSIHFAIFQMKKGGGQTFKEGLIAHGLRIAQAKNQATMQNNLEVKDANK